MDMLQASSPTTSAMTRGLEGGKHSILPKDTPEGFEDRQKPPGLQLITVSSHYECSSSTALFAQSRQAAPQTTSCSVTDHAV